MSEFLGQVREEVEEAAKQAHIYVGAYFQEHREGNI
jgi:hypothetical protein